MRERTEITVADVNRAKAAVGHLEIEIADTRVAGLSIRVRRSCAVWSLRGRLGPRQSTWRIADLNELSAPSRARERANEARRLLARGIDPGPWLLAQRLGGAVERTFDPARDGWLWEDARSRFLEFVRQERSKATFDDYRKTLNSADFTRWKDKLVKTIEKPDIQRLRDSIYERGARAQANHTLRIVKSLFSWLTDRSDSGVSVSPAADVSPIHLGAGNTEGKRVPTPEDIGRLPWLLDEAAIPPAARLAAMLTLLTVQRRQTVISALRSAFSEMEEGGIWQMAPAFTKSKRPHVLPLPSLTWSLVKAAESVGTSNSRWLWPQLRLRRKEDPGNGHMSAKSIYDAMAESGSDIRPHDCRRAFATYGESLLGFRRSDTRAILDHAEGQGGDVTAQHYALHDGTHFKWSVMQKWEEWVVEQILNNRPQGKQWPNFLSLPMRSVRIAA